MEIFLTCAPGLEPLLAEEATGAGLDARAQPGGAALEGGWAEAARANLLLRGADRVLVRLAQFRALHLAQLDKRARKVDWSALPPGTAVTVDATCRRSKIYHDRAAAQRVARAAEDALGPGAGEPVRLLLRIEDDLATISLDASGGPLHKRGFKQAVNVAPMRETLAALFLRACGYDGTGALVDPMCGSGTFAIEAAENAAGLAPGRGGSFAIERLTVHDAAAFAGLRGAAPSPRGTAPILAADRDAGAVEMTRANADRAGVADRIDTACQPVSALEPLAATGLVIVNPPYGARLGAKLHPLYAALGRVLAERFGGWRLGLVTSEAGLAKATGLELEPGPPVPHGGLKVRLWQGLL